MRRPPLLMPPPGLQPTNSSAPAPSPRSSDLLLQVGDQLLLRRHHLGRGLGHEVGVRQLLLRRLRAASPSRPAASPAASPRPPGRSGRRATRTPRTPAVTCVAACFGFVTSGPHSSLPTPASSRMNGRSAWKSAATAAEQRHGHVERRLAVHAVAIAHVADDPHQFLHPGDARLHRRVLPAVRVGSATGRSPRSRSAVRGVGRPRSGAASFSACQSDSATNGMTGCTSRRMPSSTPTSTRCASGLAGRVLAAGPWPSRCTSRRTPTR